MSFIFKNTVRVKSPENVFARRFRRVLEAAYRPERAAWELVLKNGSRVEVPTDYLIHFGRSVKVTA